MHSRSRHRREALGTDCNHRFECVLQRNDSGEAEASLAEDSSGLQVPANLLDKAQLIACS